MAKPDTAVKSEPVQNELSQINEGATREECSRTLFSNQVAPSSIEDIITIPISQLGKYVVICEFSSVCITDMKEVKMLAQNLERWWNSDGKFCVIAQGGGTSTIRFERLENESTDEL